MTVGHSESTENLIAETAQRDEFEWMDLLRVAQHQASGPHIKIKFLAKKLLAATHAIIYSTNPAADRAFFRAVLHLPHVDVGEGWLIFRLPPAEVAVHPADQSGRQELYLLCDDVETFIQEMAKRGISCTPIQSQAWGWLTQISLPGGGQLGVYQPRHARPISEEG